MATQKIVLKGRYVISDIFLFHEYDFLTFIAWFMLACALLVFFVFRKQNAPYGRYSTSASIWWGPDIPARAAWFIQELPSFLWPLYTIVFVPIESLVAKLLLACFLLHYFQRTFIFSLKIRGGKPTKLVVFLLAFAFCFVNGYLQTTYLAKYFIYDNSINSTIFIAVGISLFSIGMSINIHSDRILRRLREGQDRSHKVPHGGLFKHVSAANFFGEIVEWAGFALAQGCSLPSLAFAVFTFANIGPRAKQHHDDYLRRFPDYPKNRKAVIPFIW